MVRLTDFADYRCSFRHSSEAAVEAACPMATTEEGTSTLALTLAWASQTPPMCSFAATRSTHPLSLGNQRSIVATKVRPFLISSLAPLVIMPTSALHELARLNIQYPMTFMISNSQMGMKSFCGVLEFSAEEGMVHIPVWMMNNLCLEEGSEIILRNMNL